MFSRSNKRRTLCFSIVIGELAFQADGTLLALALQTILRLLEEASYVKLN
jgi:hypothetical protein